MNRKSDLHMSGSSDLGVVQIPVADLKPHKGNARKHSRKQIEKIAESIRVFGWLNPILVDQENTIIAGHGRLAAAQLLKLKSAPAIRAEHLNEAQKRAYMLADNKLAELADWDKDILEKELANLKSLDLDFDLEITGFALEDFDVSPPSDQTSLAAIEPKHSSLLEPKKKSNQPQVDINLMYSGEACLPTSRPSDVWILGDHRVICGRAIRRNGVIQALMQGECAAMAFTSLPINVQIEPSDETDTVKRLYFEDADGWLAPPELTSELVSSIAIQNANCRSDAYQFISTPALAINEFLAACCHFPAINLVQDYGSDLLIKIGPEDPKQSETQPPCNLLVDMLAPMDREATARAFILECTKPGALILDVFGGDGATLRAAEATGRTARVVVYSIMDADAIIEDWQTLTGYEARLEETGQRFAEITEIRELERQADPYAASLHCRFGGVKP